MDDIDNLYKNLTHIANAYSATQTIILAWGAIFALVIGQLFIAYINLSDTQKKTNLGELIVLMGFILSICWFAMSVISQRFQRDRIRKMTKLEVLIKRTAPAFLDAYPDIKIGKVKSWHLTILALPGFFAIGWGLLCLIYPGSHFVVVFILLCSGILGLSSRKSGRTGCVHQ